MYVRHQLLSRGCCAYVKLIVFSTFKQFLTIHLDTNEIESYVNCVLYLRVLCNNIGRVIVKLVARVSELWVINTVDFWQDFFIFLMIG